MKVGDPDENIFIVQTGRLNVYATDPEGGTTSLKYVKPGDSIMSLLSFLDHLSCKVHGSEYFFRSCTNTYVYKCLVNYIWGLAAERKIKKTWLNTFRRIF